MRRTLLCLALLAPACHKTSAPSTSAHTVPEPADLMATVSVASPKAALEHLAAYADAISPGVGALITVDSAAQALAQLAGAPGLSGLALDKPVDLLFLDPKTHPRPFVIFAVPADAKKLQATQGVKVVVRSGHALVGEAKAVDLLASYAFAALPARTAPAAPTLTVAPAKVFARYRADIDAFRKQMSGLLGSSPAMAKILDTEIEVAGQIADQSDEIRVSVDADAGEATLAFSVVPRAGTTFAKVTGAQAEKLDDSLLTSLPAVDNPMQVIAGRFELGPMRAAVLNLAAPFLEKVSGHALDEAWRKKWNAWFDLFDGRMAAMMWTTPAGAMSMEEMLGTSDGAKAAALAHELFPASGPSTIEIMGMKLTWESRGETSKHGDVGISEWSMKWDLSSMPPPMQAAMRRAYGDELHVYAAGFGKTFALAMGPEGLAVIGKMIDGAKSAPSPAVKAAFDAARGRKAAVAMFMNLTGSLPLGHPVSAKSGMSLEIGFAGGAVHLRVGMPAAHVRELRDALLGR